MLKDVAIRESVSLKDYSHFRIGGPARYFITASLPEDIQSAFRFASDHSLRIWVLGKGSNCLFDDRGFDGLVILNKIKSLSHDGQGVFTVGSGYNFSRLGILSSRLGWSGLEFASGIPATVGGAIFMNAGAHEQDTARHLISVAYMTQEGVRQNWLAQDLQFGYRSSPFQDRGGAILEAVFGLKRSQEAFATARALLARRQASQPLEEPSAGCFFKNPTGQSAGRLIEQAGLKGARVGGAAVSIKHANFIINASEASCADVLSLADMVKERVAAMTGVCLESEVEVVPYG